MFRGGERHRRKIGEERFEPYLRSIPARGRLVGWVGKRERERGELREGLVLEMLVGVWRSEEWETCCSTTLNRYLCAGVR